MERGRDRRLAVALVACAVFGLLPLGYAWIRLPPESPIPPPNVTLGAPIPDVTFYRVRVVEVSRLRATAEYAALLTRDGTTVGRLDRLGQPGFGNLSFADFPPYQRLAPDDTFQMFLDGGGRYALRLSWNGISVANVSWSFTPPAAAFDPPQVRDTSVLLTVASAAPVDPLDEFAALLFRDGMEVDQLSLSFGQSASMQFSDRDGDGRLSSGDQVVVSQMYVSRYNLVMTWYTLLAGNVSWVIVPPTVNLSFAAVGSDTFWFNVTGASSAMPCAAFTAIGSASGMAWDVLYDTCASLSSYGHIAFADLDGDRRVSVGDRYTVTVPYPGDMDFTVAWNGNPVTRYSWVV